MSAALVEPPGSYLQVDPVFLESILAERDRFWDVTLGSKDTCSVIIERLQKVKVGTVLVDGVTLEDVETARHVRDSSVRSYQFQCKRNEGAELQFRGMDYAELNNKNVQGITLPERLAIEHIHLLRAGSRLDRNGTVTLCAGSLFRGRYVPTVRFNAETLNIEIGMVALGVSRSNLATRHVFVIHLF